MSGSERTEGESKLDSGEAAGERSPGAGSSLARRGRSKDSVASNMSFFRAESPLDFFPLMVFGGELGLVLSLAGWLEDVIGSDSPLHLEDDDNDPFLTDWAAF